MFKIPGTDRPTSSMKEHGAWFCSECQELVYRYEAVLHYANKYLTVGQINTLLGLEKNTLATWRKTNTGPPSKYVMGNKYTYPLKTFKEWLFNEPNLSWMAVGVRARIIEHEVRSIERVINKVYLITRSEK